MVSASSSSRKRFAAWAIAGTGAAAAFIVVTSFAIGGSRFVTAFDDIAVAAAAFIAAGSCASMASRTQGRARRGWFFIALSAAAWAAGQTVKSAYEVGAGIALPVPSMADVGYLASALLAVAGVASFRTLAKNRTEAWRFRLDWVIVLISLTFGAWALGLKDVYVGAEPSFGEALTEFAYPFGAIVVVSVVILVVNRGSPHQRVPMLLLLAAFGASAAAYVAVTYADIDAFRGSRAILDSVWVGAFFLIGLAPLWPVRSSEDDQPTPVADIWQLALPWMAVAFSAVSAFVLVLRGESLDRFLTLLTAALGILLTVSQVLAHKDLFNLLARTQLSEERLSSTIASSPVGISRTNTDLKLIDANPAMAAMFHTSVKELVGTAIASRAPEPARPAILRQLEALLSGAVESAEGDAPALCADGAAIWVHWNSTVVHDASGDIDYVLTTLQDTTARHQAEESAHATLATLERLNKLKAEFLRTVSHEFKTALIGIQGFSELLSDSEDLNPVEVKSFAKDIRKSAERLDRLVTEIVDLDRVDAGRNSFRAEPVDLNVMVRREVEELKREVDGVTVITSFGQSLPAARGDPQKLAEVVRTVLHNALRYSPDGGQITVSTAVSLGEVVVNIRDQGPAERADFAGRPFGADDIHPNDPIRTVVGSGLSMGIARQIVEMHGGHFWVEALDGGSETHFTLPVAQASHIGQSTRHSVAGARVA